MDIAREEPFVTTKLWKRRDEALETTTRALGRSSTRSTAASNFLVPHLERLLAETQTVPTVDQIEPHPSHQQPATAAFAEEHAISIEARGRSGRPSTRSSSFPR